MSTDVTCIDQLNQVKFSLSPEDSFRLAVIKSCMRFKTDAECVKFLVRTSMLAFDNVVEDLAAVV
jgi:hypothetical protein